jgi:hypothetical protein
MHKNPYQVMGGQIPQMFGRKSVLEHVFQQLTKTDPVHLSVIGPQLSGKTVFLRALTNYIEKNADIYLAVIYWDFRRTVPVTDQDFINEFGKRIREALINIGAEAAEFIDETGEDVQGDICLAIEEIWIKEKRILIIFDGFDHVLASDGLTRNLWDNLLDLSRKPGIRFVTGSRGRLRELLKHNARPSIFWEQFDPTPIIMKRFDESDMEDLLLPFKNRNIGFDSSATKEFMNETGGNSILSIGLLHKLFDQAKDGSTIDGEKVITAGKEVTDKYSEILSILWENCLIDIRSDIAALAERDLSQQEIPESRFHILDRQGFAKISKNKIRASCRIFQRYTAGQAEGVTYMRRLFSNPEGFSCNIKSLLELRLAQIENGDPDLISDIQRAIRDLQPNPSYSIKWARTIVMRALELIWEKELNQDKKIPAEWINNWKSSEDQQYWKEYYVTGELPIKRLGHQCALLDKITGTEYSERVAQYVSKSTYTLVSLMNSVGDLGQHQNEKVMLGYAAAVCFVAIELCNNLLEELK